jgi:hypothetical protein|tara:strand:+ start:61 stop:546 length:486 start_codon:yes stop_codon:yes gene_type:complete
MLKKQLINYNLYLKIILIFFLLLKTSLADIIKPSSDIEPNEVVKIQLSALMKNDFPNKDSGIVQTWEFAHPNNQRVTGPIERFKNMLKTDSYSMLLNHTTHEVLEVYKSDKVATFQVTVLDKEKKYYKFKWQVEKYKIDGSLKDCWLTTAVSQPIPLGSSV